jgi:3-oxoacyl-[acyl-carrier protein] reductase
MIFQNSGLTNKVVVVTGGARGIGKAIVQAFASEGAKVHFIYHSSEQAAQALVSECETQQQQVTAWQVDVCDKARCEHVISDIAEKEQGIHVLVNNSGVVRDGLLVSLSEEDISQVMNTNVMGAFNVTQNVVPYMMRQRSGKIINISSIAGEKAGRGHANYAASKGAINAMTRALAVELAKRNITVNAVAPGMIETDMSQRVREAAGEQVLNEILLKRFGQPQEVAAAVLFLASDYANYITGEILHIDGGMKM